MGAIATIKRAFRNALDDDNYTDRRTSESTEAVEGKGQRSAALEAVAARFSLAFSQGRLDGPAELMAAVTPALLADCGRRAALDGEIVIIAKRSGSRWILETAQLNSITGSSTDRGAWQYELGVSTPDGLVKETADRSRVIHAVVRPDPSRPWRGLSLVDAAGLTARAASVGEQRLLEELGAPTGRIVSYHRAQVREQGEGIKETIQNLRGGVKMLLAPPAKQGFGGGSNLQAVRLGADVPETMMLIRQQTLEHIAASSGMAPSLLSVGGGGSEAREQLRAFLHQVISPMAGVLEHELSRVFSTTVRLDFSRLQASDVASRARAYGTYIKAGMSAADAMKHAGLQS